jgi:hypothetical protein
VGAQRSFDLYGGILYNGFRGETYNAMMFSFVDYWGALHSDVTKDFTLYPGTNIVKSRYAGSVYGFNSADYTRSQTDSFLYGLNGKWDVGKSAKIEADVAYQNSKYKTDFMALRTDRTAAGINVDFNSGGGILLQLHRSEPADQSGRLEPGSTL